MLEYNAPVDDMQFVLFDLLDAESQWRELAAFREIDRSLAKAVLDEPCKLAGHVMAPLNQSADEEGARWRSGEVTAPTGFEAAFRELTTGGWLGVSGNTDYGAQGLPKMLTSSLEEMFWGANSALYLYGTLTVGAAICIDAHASDDIKATYLPKLYAGEWTGAMALTEAHAGTDLGLIRTTAQPDGDAFRITGTKIFITSGEHDLAENIVHLVLARLPDAPDGSRGISLFVVPKYLAGGVRNGWASGSIEHKMGVRASATSVINYEGATGYLIGEPNRGLEGMFTMMNYERLSVGIQGLGLAELAYQNAARYARERLQGRSASGPQNADAAADSILVHPDVRRMMLTQRAYIEGGRALSTYVGAALDRAKWASDPVDRSKAQRIVDLTTPVVKAFLTDRGLECSVLAQQVFGGHGYIVENGAEQIVRDVRIAQIYEGTNGVQALDFAARKILRDGGAAAADFIDEMRTQPGDAALGDDLTQAIDRLEGVIDWLVQASRDDAELAGAVSVDVLDLFGHVAFGWLWSRMSAIAPEDDFGVRKRLVARFFFDKLLPKTFALEAQIRRGSTNVMAYPEDAF